jgi:hypothetical protein
MSCLAEHACVEIKKHGQCIVPNYITLVIETLDNVVDSNWSLLTKRKKSYAKVMDKLKYVFFLNGAVAAFRDVSL